MQIAGLHKSFGPVDVLRRIDPAIGRGEKLTLISPSGTGKTTLLPCAAGFRRGGSRPRRQLTGAPELRLRSRDLSSEFFMPMQIYVISGVIYFSMAAPLSAGVRRLERRRRRELWAAS